MYKSAYLFIQWWTRVLLPHLSYCDNSAMNMDVQLSLRSCFQFFWIYTDKSYCWIIVQLLSRLRLLCDSMDYSPSGFPVFHYLLEFAQTHVHWISDAIQPSHPLLSPSPPALNLSQHQNRIFSNESALCIRWTNYWSLGSVLSHVASNDNPISLLLRNHHTTFHSNFTIFLLLPIVHKGFNFSTASPTFIFCFFQE